MGPNCSILQGDTLSKIAREFSTSVEVLTKMNGIKDPDFIFAGKPLAFARSELMSPG